MGTPELAVPVLSALLDAGNDIVSVYTRPDKRTGRGKRLALTPVKRYAQGRGLPVCQPASLRPPQVQGELASYSPDVIAVAAYGLFLPPATLQMPRLGCLNVHPSLLPRYRGPSPVASAILSGDSVTGATIMKIDEGMDAGPILARRETTIGPQEDAEELTMRLFQLGASLLVEVLPAWAQGQIQACPQDDSQATTTRRLSKEDGEIDWGLDAAHIARRVRAYHPWPGSFTRWGGKLLKVVEAAAVGPPDTATSSPPGQVVSLSDGGLGIATGEGVLAVRRLQMEGRRAVEAGEFLRGYPAFVGSALGS